MSYDNDDFMKALEKATEGLITPEMAERQRVMRARNHERLVRLGLAKN